MSMTSDEAQIYVCNILGGSGNDETKARALQSIGAVMEQWCIKNDWHFLLQDTTQPFTVAGCITTISTAIVTVDTALGNFANVLKGMTVTGTGIPASTTVLSVDSESQITLSANATASNAPLTLSFGGTIPVIAGTSRYKLPTRFNKPYLGGARLVSTLKRPLRFVRRGVADMIMADPTLSGSPTHYTIHSTDTDFDASGKQQEEIELIRVPQANDVLLFKYYRRMDYTKDPIDVKDGYLFTLLDHARIHLLFSKNSSDSRLPGLVESFKPRLAEIISDDRKEGGEDEFEGFVTPTELGYGSVGIEFWPQGDR